MKPFTKQFLFTLTLLIAATSLNAQDTWTHQDYLDNGWKRYQHEKGILHYKYDGSISGKETVYFDSYGWREGKFSEKTISMFGMNQQENKLDVIDGEIQTGIDLNTNQGNRIINSYIQGLRQGNSSKDLTDIGTEMLEAMGGKKVGTGEVLGKTCDIYEVANMGTKTWIWNGISMKTETSMMGMNIVIEATKLELDVAVEEEKVTVPEGAVINDLGSLQNFGFGN